MYQSIAILEFQPQEKDADLQPRRAHLIHSSDSISIFRPLNGVAQEGTGFFGIYASSHHQTPEEFATSKKDVHQMCVTTSGIILVLGGTFVQPSKKGGLRMVWQGFATEPMLSNIYAPNAFEFMTM